MTVSFLQFELNNNYSALFLIIRLNDNLLLSNIKADNFNFQESLVAPTPAQKWTNVSLHGRRRDRGRRPARGRGIFKLNWDVSKPMNRGEVK